MLLEINGESRDVPDNLTIDRLIDHLQLRQERVAIELNRAIVRRSIWPQTELHDGDVIEIVHFVGGG